MPNVRSLFVLVGLAIALLGVTSGCATEPPSDGVDARGSATSGHEGRGISAVRTESSTDLEITRQIRAAVRGDASLSTMARNVTIITLGAVVTLRGNVTSNREREVVARHARAVAGVQRIDNVLSVRASPRE